MNSYPAEFLSHPQPLMFVAGLGASAGESAPKPRTYSVTTDSTFSPPPAAPALSPGLDESAPLPVVNRDPRAGEFERLTHDLRRMFEPYTRAPRVWLPERERKEFRVVLVDKTVRLPARKAEGGHSPLSPLTPGSPAYPDGLIAPLWVRKHTDAVPSAFVLFLRLYESPPRQAGPPLGVDVLADAERQLERDADDALVREISERRTRLGARGIKMTVVLMASAAALELDGLNERLSAIRRASGLPAKASLYVLSPVVEDLPEFVGNIMEALYDSAMESYNAHGKRVRRKRSRVPPAAPPPPGRSGTRSRSGSIAGLRSRSGSVVGRPLSPQGWMVRYDWKAGWFAEVRGELDLARRHYEDCWNELSRMFGSTNLLPPRTKRWAEAKALADCLAIRICKLLLYENVPRTMAPFFVHIRRFADLMRGWGLDETTFDYWAWIARQYRLLGEMLELAVDNGFQVPPIPVPSYAADDETQTPMSAVNPSHILQSPAFYFYTAASFTLERKARFDAAVDAEETGRTPPSTGIAAERTVPHNDLVVDLLRRAENLLRKSEQHESGLDMYIAAQMAAVQAGAGQSKEAAQLLGEVLPKFDASWGPLVREMEGTWYAAAQATGDVDAAARLLLHRLARGGDDGALQDDLLTLFKTTTPASDAPLEIDGLVEARVGFRQAEAATGSAVPFQISLAAAPDVEIPNFEFARLAVSFSDGRPDLVITPGDGRRVNVGVIAQAAVEHAGQLSFPPVSPLLITGELQSDDSDDVEVDRVTLSMKYGTWCVNVNAILKPLTKWTTDKASFVPVRSLHTSVAFAHRAPSVTLQVTHSPSAFVDEPLRVKILVKSEDDREVQLRLNVVLQPGPEPDGASIGFQEQVSESHLKLDLGNLAPSSTLERALILRPPAPGTKVVDLSLSAATDDEAHEHTHTAIIPVLAPFALSASTSVPAVRGAPASVSATLTAPSPRAVVVTGIALQADEGTLLTSSLTSTSFPQTWDGESAFAFAARFALQTKSRLAPPGPCGSLVLTWRPADWPQPTSTDPYDLADLSTTLPLPALLPPPPEAFVTASLAYPARTRTHAPFSLSLTITNAHPADSALVHVHGETAEGFVWAGPRSARAIVHAGETRKVDVRAVAVGAAGWVPLPHLSVWLGEGGDRREVRVGAPLDRPGGCVLVQP